MKSQVASPTYTPVFAALVAVIGTRLPDVPTLLVHRLLAQFKRAFKRNDRALTSSVVTFLCHLANQHVRQTFQNTVQSPCCQSFQGNGEALLETVLLGMAKLTSPRSKGFSS